MQITKEFNVNGIPVEIRLSGNSVESHSRKYSKLSLRIKLVVGGKDYDVVGEISQTRGNKPTDFYYLNLDTLPFNIDGYTTFYDDHTMYISESTLFDVACDYILKELGKLHAK